MALIVTRNPLAVAGWYTYAMQPTQHEYGEYTISSDAALLQIEQIHKMLEGSYWAKDRPRSVTETALQHSIVFGLYHKGVQVGFARVISDQALIAYLLDVIIVEEHRGKGLGKWMLEVILKHPDLQTIKRFLLTTGDAHLLYQKYGFRLLKNPEMMMERTDG